MEREAGVPLLERAGRSVRLTDAARILVEHTEAVLERLERAESELARQGQEIRGTVRVASFQSVLLEIAPRALTSLAARHPHLRVELIHRDVEDAHASLLSHDFDLVLGEELPGSPQPRVDGVDREDFLDDPIRLAVPSASPVSPCADTPLRRAARAEPDRTPRKQPGTHMSTPRRLADLAHADWALEQRWSKMGAWSRLVCRTAGFEPRPRCEAPDPLLHLHLVRTGHAVAFVCGLMGAEYLSGIDLLDLPDSPCRRLYTEIRAGREGHPALVAVRAAVAEAAQQCTVKPAAYRLTE
ncbi:LysR substrate-binding domain-containing protein [Streptomyces sp. NPDC004561]